MFAFIWGFGFVVGVCNFLNSVNKNLKQWTLKPLDKLCHSCRTDQCYSSELQFSFIQKIKQNTSSRHDDMPTQKMRREERERERTLALWLLFLYVFPPPLGLPYVNWASPECYLFYLRSSLWSLKLPLFYCLGLFPSLPFSHHHSGLLFPIPTTQQFDGSCKKSIIFHSAPSCKTEVVFLTINLNFKFLICVIFF